MRRRVHHNRHDDFLVHSGIRGIRLCLFAHSLAPRRSPTFGFLRLAFVKASHSSSLNKQTLRDTTSEEAKCAYKQMAPSSRCCLWVQLLCQGLNYLWHMEHGFRGSTFNGFNGFLAQPTHLSTQPSLTASSPPQQMLCVVFPPNRALLLQYLFKVTDKCFHFS